MYTWKTIKENYHNPIFKGGYRYIHKEIRKILEKEGLTENNRQDLWLCLLEDEEHEIPYRALGKVDAKIMYFLSELCFIVFQNRIIERAVRNLGIKK